MKHIKDIEVAGMCRGKWERGELGGPEGRLCLNCNPPKCVLQPLTLESINKTLLESGSSQMESG